MLTTSDKAHILVLSVLDGSAIVANLVLVYAIWTRTPPRMRSYSILLLNNAFVDISSATASLLCVSRLIYMRELGAQMCVFVGPCCFLGEWFCQLCQTIHTFFVAQSAIILLHSFCFRLYILKDSHVRVSVTARVTILICISLYGPTVLMMYFYYVSSDYAPQGLVESMHLRGYVVTWFPNIYDPHFICALGFIMILSPSAIVSLFVLRGKLIDGIKLMEKSAKNHHSNIAKALTYQLLLPVGQPLAWVLWVSVVARLWTDDEIPERLIMIVSSFFALGSPLINLTFLPPYRRLFNRHRTTTKALSLTTSTT